MAYSDLRDFIDALEKKKELKRISVRSGSVSRDHRIRRPRREERRPRAAVRETQGQPHSGADQRFASMRRMEMALEVDSVESIARASTNFSKCACRRADRQAEDAAEAGRSGRVLSEDGFERPVQGSDPARQFFAERISRSCTAGRRMAGASSRCRWCSRAIPTPASATAAATGCRFTTSAPPACTGRRTSRAPSIIGGC
jgi:hypothetical protein